MVKMSIPERLDYAWSISSHLRSPALWVFTSQKDQRSYITLLMSASSKLHFVLSGVEFLFWRICLTGLIEHTISD